MIRTYTPADIATLTLPALPGLLDGWCGPVEVFEHRAEPGHPNADTVVAHDERWPGYWRPGIWPVHNAGFSTRLPFSRWECRARVVAWLAAGERCDCPPCEHEEGYVEPDTNALICRVCEEAGGCVRCHGTGHLRAPADLRWALDWPGLSGSLLAWQSAALLHASAVRMAAGMGVVRGLLGAREAKWIDTRDGRRSGFDRPSLLPHALAAIDCLTAAEIDEVETRWLQSGLALMDDGALRVETPT